MLHLPCAMNAGQAQLSSHPVSEYSFISEYPLTGSLPSPWMLLIILKQLYLNMPCLKQALILSQSPIAFIV